jgi:hypothetical protein
MSGNEPEDHQMSLATLRKWCEDNDIDEESLDDLVIDLHSSRASEVNNGGVDAQLELILQEFGDADAARVALERLVMEEPLPVHGLNEDQPATCPQCGCRTDFEDGEDSKTQIHTCLDAQNCGYKFKGIFE